MASKDSSYSHVADREAAVSPSMRSLEELFPPVEESCVLSVACRPSDYSASRLAHAVEDCDAHLLNLNVTSQWLPSGEVVVDLRVSHRNPGSVARSLERYGYPVVSFIGQSDSDTNDDIMRERVSELMRILDT